MHKLCRKSSHDSSAGCLPLLLMMTWFQLFPFLSFPWSHVLLLRSGADLITCESELHGASSMTRPMLTLTGTAGCCWSQVRTLCYHCLQFVHIYFAKIYAKYTQNMQKICQKYARNMQNTCKIYAKYASVQNICKI